MSGYKQAALDSIDSLHVFVQNFWNVLNPEDKFIDGWHIEYLCDYYQKQILEFGSGGDDYHVNSDINVPPGTSKSTILSQMAQVWTWLHFPHFVFITTSYSGTLANDHSSKAKKIVNSAKFQYFYDSYFENKFGRKLRITKDKVNDWETTLGGRRYATSTDGTVTGIHAHVIIKDDGMSQQQSQSKAHRLKIHNFNDKTLPPRRKDILRGPIFNIGQRLHADDTTGHDVERGKTMNRIVLPAMYIENQRILRPDYLKEYYVDGLLEPNRLSREALAQQKDELGSSDFDGQYQQSPTAIGGNIVKKDWFVIIKESMLPTDIVWDMWLDGAYTKKTENDPTGIVIQGYSPSTKKLYWKYASSKWLELPELVTNIDNVWEDQELTNRSRAYVEPKASGKSIKQTVDRELKYVSMTEIDKEHSTLVSDGKLARCQVAAVKIESGRLVLVEGNWNDAVIAQLTGFPNASHDEYVDLAGYGCDFYFKPMKKKRRRRSNLG